MEFHIRSHACPRMCTISPYAKLTTQVGIIPLMMVGSIGISHKLCPPQGQPDLVKLLPKTYSTSRLLPKSFLPHFCCILVGCFSGLVRYGSHPSEWRRAYPTRRLCWPKAIHLRDWSSLWDQLWPKTALVSNVTVKLLICHNVSIKSHNLRVNLYNRTVHWDNENESDVKVSRDPRKKNVWQGLTHI